MKHTHRDAPSKLTHIHTHTQRRRHLDTLTEVHIHTHTPPTRPGPIPRLYDLKATEASGESESVHAGGTPVARSPQSRSKPKVIQMA